MDDYVNNRFNWGFFAALDSLMKRAGEDEEGQDRRLRGTPPEAGMAKVDHCPREALLLLTGITSASSPC
ncbi:MAG: hypothetical protein U0527_16995 [Candidatus Eisenbacteria bacterium]